MTRAVYPSRMRVTRPPAQLRAMVAPVCVGFASGRIRASKECNAEIRITGSMKEVWGEETQHDYLSFGESGSQLSRVRNVSGLVLRCATGGRGPTERHHCL